MTRPPPNSPLFPSTPFSRPPITAASARCRRAYSASEKRGYSCSTIERRRGSSRSIFLARQLLGDRFAQLRQAIAEKLARSEEHTSELQSPCNLVCRLLLEKK